MVLENDHVRVLRFRLGPHEKSMVLDVAEHLHVAVTDQHVQLVYVYGKPRARQRKAGDSAWMERDAYGVENLSDKPVEWVLVETRDGKRG